MTPTDLEHGLRLVPREHASPDPLAREPPPPRLGLSWLDQLAAAAFVDGDSDQLVDLVRESAQSMTGTTAERDAARTRLLAREIAITKVAVDALTVALGERVRAHDERGEIRVDRLLMSATRRLAILCAEHRAGCVSERRPSILVAHADQVHVDAGQ